LGRQSPAATPDPHFKKSNDPAFAAKVEDIAGLYMNPPAHAVVVFIDEKSQTQALDRTQPGLPLKPGKCGPPAPLLQAQRHHHSVRRPQHSRRHCCRPRGIAYGIFLRMGLK
jgi:hypothetical protein